MRLATRIEKAWYRRHVGLMWLLLPLEVLYRCVSQLRKWQVSLTTQHSQQQSPVIIVGNISVGGTGKTPLVIAIVRWLKSKGYKPGVISRGYGGRAASYPHIVTAISTAAEVGDEPLLIARSADCPVVVAPNRVDAHKLIEDEFGCDVVVSDDGLQHYALSHDIEIAVVDGMRGLGNGHCMPVGPLREPASRLQSVDMVVVNGDHNLHWGEHCHYMVLEAGNLVNLKTGEKASATTLPTQVHAVCGIGNPRRFLTTLVEQGLRPIAHRFSDHHAFSASDFEFGDDLPIVMTQKDAVKCRSFATENMWELPVRAALPAEFFVELEDALEPLFKDT